MRIGEEKSKVHKIPKPIKVKNWPAPKPIPVEIPKKETVPASK